MPVQPLPSTIATEAAPLLLSCPVALLYKTPIIDEVFDAHRWMKQLHQPLTDAYPKGIPDAIYKAVLALDAGLQMAEHERHEKRMQEIDKRSNVR